MDWLWNFLDASDFLPRGHCAVEKQAWAGFIGAYMLFNLLIGLSYVAIFCQLLYFRKKYYEFAPLFWSLPFGIFILMCGLGHFLEEIGAFWWPNYRVFTVFDGLTVIPSLGVAVLFFPTLLHLTNRHKIKIFAAEILDTIADGVIVIDEHGTIQSTNIAVERLFGYTASELRGRNVKILMPAELRKSHDENLARYLAGGEAHIIGIGRDAEALHKQGFTFPVHLAVSELRHGDRRLFTGVVHDLRPSANP